MARVNVDRLEINNISNAAGIFSGLNVQYRWRHATKGNETLH